MPVRRLHPASKLGVPCKRLFSDDVNSPLPASLTRAGTAPGCKVALERLAASGSDPLDDDGRSHAARSAHGDEAVAAPRTFEFVERGAD